MSPIDVRSIAVGGVEIDRPGAGSTFTADCKHWPDARHRVFWVLHARCACGQRSFQDGAEPVAAREHYQAAMITFNARVTESELNLQRLRDQFKAASKAREEQWTRDNQAQRARLEALITAAQLRAERAEKELSDLKKARAPVKVDSAAENVERIKQIELE